MRNNLLEKEIPRNRHYRIKCFYWPLSMVKVRKAQYVNNKHVIILPVSISMFGFITDIALLLYKPKRQKNVLMLTTFQSGDNIDPVSGELQKPEIVIFYNLTKMGDNMFEELKSTYSVSKYCAFRPRRKTECKKRCAMLQLAQIIQLAQVQLVLA